MMDWKLTLDIFQLVLSLALCVFLWNILKLLKDLDK